MMSYPVYTIQPVVNRFDNRFDNWFDNRLYRVNGAFLLQNITTMVSGV